MKLLVFQADLIQPLDQLRIAALRLFMKSISLRRIYSDRACRLGFNFLVLTGLYLVISFKWSLVLLVLGPMVLGYPHLIASYRFLQRSNLRLSFRLGTHQVFRFFLLLTAASLCIRFIGAKFGYVPELAYGSWELLLSTLALGLIKLKINSTRHVLVALFTLLIVGLVLNFAWHFPLVFVGFALIFHNWVAFGHWFLAAKDFRNRIVVSLAVALFALIHFLVFNGYFDSWISFSNLNFLSTQSFEASGWVLASWSTDPLVWNRMIVIYTFGLSMHYFVWLTAIPQCLDQKSVPNSFRRSLEQLRKECGEHMSVILFVGAAAIIAIWLFTTMAGPIYFGLAMLHGWLEFTFLIIAVLSAGLKATP